MLELYWITRLDTIGLFLTIVAIVSFLATVALLITAVMIHCAAESYEEKAESTTPRRWGIRFLVITLVVGFINSLIPTTKEALIIYGVGGTIDYLEDNSVAKELPDKVITCIDKLLNEYLIEEPRDQSNREP